MRIMNAGALVRDFTLTGCTNAIGAHGSAVYISDGVADNIRVTKNKRTDGATPKDGVVHILNGTLKNSLIDHNAVIGVYNQYGAGVTLGYEAGDGYAPVMTNCVIAFNSAEALSSANNGNGNAANGVGVALLDGTVVDCEIHDNYVENINPAHKGIGIYVDGTAAVMESCRVHSNKGTGVYLANGIVKDSLVENNVAPGAKTTKGIGIYQVNGTIVDCEVRGNDAEERTLTHEGFGIYIGGSAAVTERCRVYANHGNGVYVRGGGILRNTLVCDNVSEAPMPGGLRLENGTVVNCTMANNTSLSSASQDAYLALFPDSTTGIGTITMVNCIVVNGKVENGYFTDCVFNNNLVSNATGDAISDGAGNIIGEEPKFKATTGETAYHLRGISKAVNAGDSSFWSGIAKPRDLAGNARIIGENVDLGCFEYKPSGFMLILK